MKSAGIITMHRVHNYGSVLQALALEKSVHRMGFLANIIDYVFPDTEATSGTLTTRLKVKIHKLFSHLGVPGFRKARRFSKFCKKHLHTTSTSITYSNRHLLKKLNFDIYITGSDQVWNPKYMGKHNAFLLDFAPNESRKISYGSSFATNNLLNSDLYSYKALLSRYQFISVRESSSVKLIDENFGLAATHVCDPTLLLSRDEWMTYAQPISTLPDKFILVYILTYSYNPYPEIDNVIQELKHRLNLPVVYIDGIDKQDNINIKEAGPGEFLYLFSKASFVITTSFHGTAFALNFNIPFISLIEKRNNSDDRIENLLTFLGAEEHALIYNKPLLSYTSKISDEVKIKLNNFINQSREKLRINLYESQCNNSSI